MRKQEIGELCCKVLSIYTFIAALSNSQGAFLSLFAFRSSSRPVGGSIAPTVVLNPLLALFVPFLLLLCLSACLWLYADRIAMRMFPEDEKSAVMSTGPMPETIRRIAFIVAGILILNSAISALTNPVLSLFGGFPRQMTIYSTVYLVEAMIRIVLGIGLILSARKSRIIKSAS